MSRQRSDVQRDAQSDLDGTRFARSADKYSFSIGPVQNLEPEPKDDLVDVTAIVCATAGKHNLATYSIALQGIYSISVFLDEAASHLLSLSTVIFVQARIHSKSISISQMWFELSIKFFVLVDNSIAIAVP